MNLEEKQSFKKIIPLEDLPPIPSEEDLLEIMKKELRTLEDNRKIMSYLRSMNDLLEILKRQNENCKDLLHNISNALQYVNLPEYKTFFRYGEKGDAFYVILKGRINVIIPNQKEYILSKEEYLEYLCLLSHYGEKELLTRCLDTNKYMTHISESEIKEYIHKNKRKFPTIADLVVSDYTDKLKPVIKEGCNDKRKSLQIYTFHLVKQLKTGDIFGDLALDNINNKRTATILSDCDCHFGMILKGFYVKSIQDTNTKFKKNNLAFIMGTPFFQGVTNKSSLYHFQKMCVNAFTNRKIDRKDYLIKENEEPISVFFIKSGQFEICMNKSVMEINELIRYFGGHLEDDLNEYEVMYEDSNFNNFMNTKKYSKVSNFRIIIVMYLKGKGYNRTK
jgi:CRP-like cAMP-binding protein